MLEAGAEAERLRVARELVGSRALDIEAALALLNTVPETIGQAGREAIEHAKRAVAAAPGGDHRHQAVARYMIARVLVVLERAALDGRRSQSRSAADAGPSRPEDARPVA